MVISEQVEACSIGELEFKASTIATQLQQDLQKAAYGDERHYLLQYGDNSGVFDAVLNNMCASGHGMRKLCNERRSLEQESPGLLGGRQLNREFNAAADALVRPPHLDQRSRRVS